jgi:WD40 repeat protein
MKLTRASIIILVLSVILLATNVLAFDSKLLESYVKEDRFTEVENYCNSQPENQHEKCYQALANLCLKYEKLDFAAKYYAKTNDKNGFKKVGDAYLKQKQYDKAYQCYLKAGQAETDSQKKIANTAFSDAAYDKALEYYEKLADAKKIAQVKEKANIAAEDYLTKKDYENAGKCFSIAGSKEGLKKVAEGFLGKGDYQNAAVYFENTGDKEGLKKVAEGFLVNGDYQNAAVLYGKLADKDGLKKVAEGFFTQSDFENAGLYFEKIDDKTGLKKIADICLEKTDYENAIKYYKKAGDFKSVADICFTRMDYQNALTYYLKANYIEGTKKCYIKLAEKMFSFINSDTTLGSHSSWVTSVAISADGRYAISGSLDKTVKLWDLATGKETRTFSGHTDCIQSVAISADDRYVISGSKDKTVKLWDLTTGKEIRTFSGHKDKVNSVAISADNRYIISGSFDNTVKLWDLTSGKEIRTFTGHSNIVYSVAISADNRYIISGSGDGTIRLWDLTTGKEIRTFSVNGLGIHPVAISADGCYIIAGNGDFKFKLWDLTTGREIRTFSGHNNIVISVAISADNRYIISGSLDHTIKLWDLATGKEIRTISGHTDGVSAVAISADNYYIISGSEDNTVKLWFNGGDATNIAFDYYKKAGLVDTEINLVIAEQYMKNLQMDKAIAIYDKLGVQYEQQGDRAGIIKITDACFLIAEQYIKNQQQDKAIAIYEKLGGQYERLGDQAGIKKIADAYFLNGLYNKAWIYYEKINDLEGLKKVLSAFLAINDYSGVTGLNHKKMGYSDNDFYQIIINTAVKAKAYDYAFKYYEKLIHIEGLKNPKCKNMNFYEITGETTDEINNLLLKADAYGAHVDVLTKFATSKGVFNGKQKLTASTLPEILSNFYKNTQYQYKLTHIDEIKKSPEITEIINTYSNFRDDLVIVNETKIDAKANWIDAWSYKRLYLTIEQKCKIYYMGKELKTISFTCKHEKSFQNEYETIINTEKSALIYTDSYNNLLKDLKDNLRNIISFASSINAL